MIAWLTSLFNRPTTSLPWNQHSAKSPLDLRDSYREGMSVDELLTALDKIIEKQLSDADDKLSRPEHWGPVASLVSSAAQGSRQVVAVFLEANEVGTNESAGAFVASLDQLKQQLMAARRQYDAVYNDEDGYGGAAYMEVIRDIHHLQEALGYTPSHTIAELRESVHSL